MQRKNIIILMISLSLVLLLGSSYALLISREVGTTPYVINVGTLQVTFEEGKTEKLSLENMYPMSDKDGSSLPNELGFTVKNTGTVASYYDIILEETSTNPEFKSVIRYIINKDEKGYNQPKTLVEDKFIEVGGYLKPNESSNYKIKVWLDYNADNTYMDKEFKAKVVVNSFQESNYAKDVIKSKLVKYEASSKEDFNGGLVAVNTNGELYNETDSSQEIREYRYSGLNVNNYVTYNDETWRIIGVFNDEEGEEHLKIVRNEELKREILPLTYSKNEIEYKIQYLNGDFAYWNNRSSYNNDWATAGLQYWLNGGNDVETKSPDAGYMSYLSESSKKMIEETKYYLGAVTFENPYYIKDTTNEAYKNERTVKGCIEGKGTSENNSQSAVEGNSSCRVWANNQATWEGSIALLYPSDYGYSADSNYWNTILGKNSFETPSNSSWLQKRIKRSASEWLLTPISLNANSVAYWFSDGHTSYASVYDGFCDVRPCLYLKSNVKITSGTGEENNPYKLSLS